MDVDVAVSEPFSNQALLSYNYFVPLCSSKFQVFAASSLDGECLSRNCDQPPYIGPNIVCGQTTKASFRGMKTQLWSKRSTQVVLAKADKGGVEGPVTAHVKTGFRQEGPSW